MEARKEAGPEIASIEYRALFEAAPDGIVLVDETASIPDANPRALEMFGYERDANGSGPERDPELELELELELYRIVREALENVREHARARRAVVRIARRRGTITASVEDDGGGFDV